MKRKILKTIEIIFLIILLIIGAFLEASRTFIMENSQNGNVKYDFIDFNNDGVSEFLIISGNGTVKIPQPNICKNVEIIYICRGIYEVEPRAFAEIPLLKFLIIPYEAYSLNLELPKQTDLLFIDDNEYKEFVNLYI